MMTNEEKQLLLKDLCPRLFYGVKCINITWPKDGYVIVSNIRVKEQKVQIFEDWVDIEYCKPYLRPMSSMTEEEYKTYKNVSHHSHYGSPSEQYYSSIDWLNEHHFDYRGLIPMGLALEAPEGMYKID